MGQPKILAFIICFGERHIHTCWRFLWMYSSNSWTGESPLQCRDLCRLFFTPGRTEKIGNGGGEATAKLARWPARFTCKHSISLTTWMQLGIKGDDFILRWLYGWGVWGGEDVVSITISAHSAVKSAQFHRIHMLFFTFQETFRLMKPPAEAFIRGTFPCFYVLGANIYMFYTL